MLTQVNDPIGATQSGGSLKISDAYRKAIAQSKSRMAEARATTSYGTQSALRLLAKEDWDQATLIAHLLAYAGDLELDALTPQFEKSIHEKARRTDRNETWRFTYAEAIQAALRYGRSDSDHSEKRNVP